MNMRRPSTIIGERAVRSSRLHPAPSRHLWTQPQPEHTAPRTTSQTSRPKSTHPYHNSLATASVSSASASYLHGGAPQQQPQAPSTSAAEAGLHPILEVLQERLRSGSRPGTRTDGARIGLVVEGGGMQVRTYGLYGHDTRQL